MGLTWIVFLLATANSQWEAARESGHPSEELLLPPEERDAEEVGVRGQYAGYLMKRSPILMSRQIQTRRALQAPS